MLVALIGCSVGLGLLSAWPMAILVDAVLTPTPHISSLQGFLLSCLGEDKVTQILGIALAGMFIKVLSDGIWMLRMMLNNRIRYNGSNRVRGELYQKLGRLNVGWHHGRSQGDTIYRIGFDSNGPWGITDTLIGSGTALITLISMTAIMMWRSLPLTIFALSIIPLLAFANHHFGNRIRARAAAAKEAEASITTVLQRTLENINLVQLFCREKRELASFERSLSESADAAITLNWQETLYPFVVQTIFSSGGAIIFGYGGYLVYCDQFLSPKPNGLTPGDVMVFMAYLGQLWDPLSWVLGFPIKIQTHLAACERVFEVLDEPELVKDEEGSVPLPVKPRTLSLSNLYFGYTPEELILKNINVSIRPGEMVSFLGPSGTGKSTLLNLIPRFYDPLCGSIKLDSHDIREVKLRDVRSHMALVMQGSPLFPGTIAFNLRYGAEDATDEELEAAAEEAGIAEFIEGLPDRYQTEIQEGGQNLSGGQRQRLAIARALVTQAPILILDEPTSALDAAHEQWVMETLTRLRGRRTIILVTHRLDTVRHCDRIYMMNNGTVVEQGSHLELIKEQGLYFRLLNHGSLSLDRNMGERAEIALSTVSTEAVRPLLRARDEEDTI